MGGAAGIGYRGLTGLRDTLAAPSHTPPVSTQLPQTLKLDQITPDADQEKLASGGLDATQNWLAEKLAPMLPKSLGSTTKPLMNALGMPMGVMAAGGSAYGGYKLTDWILNKEKERNQESQLGAAETDYQNALAEQYQAAMQAKQAGDDLGIDSLVDVHTDRQKQAEGGILQSANDAWGATSGVITTGMLLSALGSGALTYNHVRGKNKQDVLAKALKRRQMQRARYSPPPILAEVPKQSDAA